MFAKDKRGISVLLKVDNTTAVAYRQSWGNSIQDVLNTRPMHVVPGDEHLHPGTVPSRCTAPYSRHGVDIHEGLIKLETGLTDVCEYQQTLWTTGGGLVWIQADRSVPLLLQLAA